MKREQIYNFFVRLFIFAWVAAPLALIYLNYNGIWLWTPFGKIEPSSTGMFASCTWLFVFYILPFVVLWILKPLWVNDTEAGNSVS